FIGERHLLAGVNELPRRRIAITRAHAVRSGVFPRFGQRGAIEGWLTLDDGAALHTQFAVRLLHFEIVLGIAEGVGAFMQKARLRKNIETVFEQPLTTGVARCQPRQAITERDRALIVIAGLVSDFESFSLRRIFGFDYRIRHDRTSARKLCNRRCMPEIVIIKSASQFLQAPTRLEQYTRQ